MDYTPEFQTPESPPLWRQLAREIQDWIHTPAKPELKLESEPVPVKELWEHHSSIKQRASSIAIHAAILGVILLPFWHPVRLAVQHETIVLAPTIFAPGSSLPKMNRLAGGGAPVHLLLPPKLMPVNDKPLPVPVPLALLPATAQANVPLPAFGDPGKIAGPPGINGGASGAGPGGMGTAANGGGDCVTGPCAVGGDVSEPVLIDKVNPQYSDAARQAKFQGTVLVSVIIGADGRVYKPKILQHLGLGLDQKALEAVKLWRFRPAMKDGHAVAVIAEIQVNFHLY